MQPTKHLSKNMNKSETTIEKPAAARIHCQFYNNLKMYSFDIADQTSEFTLLEAICHFISIFFKGLGECCRRRHTDSVQNCRGLITDVCIGHWRGGRISCSIPTSILEDLDSVCTTTWISTCLRVALSQNKGSSVVVWALFQTVAIVERVDRVIKIEIGIVFGWSPWFSAGGVVSSHSSEYLVGVAVGVGMDGAVHHSANAEEEQNTTEYVSALSVVLVQWPPLHILEIWFLFTFCLNLLLSCHSIFPYKLSN